MTRGWSFGLRRRGGQLHERWVWLIEHQLDELAQLELGGKTSELDDIRAHAPNAIPGPLMRTLWRQLLGGRVRSPWRKPDLYRMEGPAEARRLDGHPAAAVARAAVSHGELERDVPWRR